MKRIFGKLILMPLVFAVTMTLNSTDANAALRTAAKVEGIKDFFLTGDYYIGGQPNLETLRMLKTQGVTLVVNLRSESENKDFAATAFNEENMVKELGMSYLPLPVGDKESCSPNTVDKLAEALKVNKGKALIHCAVAVRATQLWMACLVRCRGFSLNEAVAVGKEMKFTLLLEGFLGVRISLKMEEEQK